MDLHSAVSRAEGVSDAKLFALPQYEEAPFFSDRERAALDYATGMTASPVEVSDALFETVSGFYSPDELIELTCTIAFENLLSRFHRALAIESQGFCPIRPSNAPERVTKAAGQ